MSRSDLSNSVNDEKAIAFLACHLAQGQAAPKSTEGAGGALAFPWWRRSGWSRTGRDRDAVGIMALQAVELLALKEDLDPLLK